MNAISTGGRVAITLGLMAVVSLGVALSAPAPAQADSAVTLSGTVKDSNGDPVAGAQVLLEGSGLATVQTTANNSGVYSLDAAPGHYSLMEVQFGRPHSHFVVTTTGDLDLTADRTINMTMPLFDLTFHVTDSEGEPSPGANVTNGTSSPLANFSLVEGMTTSASIDFGGTTDANGDLVIPFMASNAQIDVNVTPTTGRAVAGVLHLPATDHDTNPTIALYLVPTRPQDVGASDSSNTVTVDWDAPADSGSFPITGYELTVEPATAPGLRADPAGLITKTVGPGARSFSFQNIPVGKRYRYRVYAKNKAGRSQAAVVLHTIDHSPPATTITAGPSATTRDRTPTFSFRSSEAGSSFKCSLDSGPYAGCRSPKTYAQLAFGSHNFRVKATDPAGNTDPTAAMRTFKIVR